MKSPRYSLIPLYNQYAILIVFYNQRRRADALLNKLKIKLSLKNLSDTSYLQ